MKVDCRQIKELLPDFLQGTLDAEPAHTVQAHLEACAVCREEVALWQRLGTIAAPQPDASARPRFDAVLAAYQTGRSEQQRSRPAWPRGLFDARAAQFAAAAAVIAIAFAVGLLMGRSGTQSREIATLHRELADTRQLVALSMLQEQSASDRLEGVSWSTRLERPRPEVVEALLATLRRDSSVDVRLAALDALRRYRNQPMVRTRIADSLPRQKSPLVQVAVVDFLVDAHDRSAIETLRSFEQTPDLMPEVREHIHRGIDELNRG